MDFESRYTPEQEEFRREVSAWLRENVPDGMEHPADPADLTWDQYQLRRDLGRKLGDMGWLWPTAPAEYGGGGLDVDSAVVIEEEIDAFGLTLPPYYDSGGRLGGNSILVWGSEEQKHAFLPPIFTGRVRTWQLLSEPEAGSDLANVKTQAIPPDGDDPVWRYSADTVNHIGPLSGLLINEGFVSYTWKTGSEDRREYERTADPTRHAASLFDNLLEARGLVITRRPQAGTAPPLSQLTSLGRIESPDMVQIVARMLTRSDNTIAEMLLKEIGWRTVGSERALAAEAVEGVMARLLGPVAAGIDIADGSGLSRYNRLTCAAVAELLRLAGPRSPLVEGLPVAGRSGTLKTCGPATWPPIAGRPNAVYAKTGTVHLSNALAGVAQALNGETVTFAMIANRPHMNRLSPCNALRTTLINAAARYTYGPAASWDVSFDLGVWPVLG